MSSTRADQEIEDVWLGCVYAWLCTSATVEGLARGRVRWAAGQIGNRPTPVNGCPQDDPLAKTIGAAATGSRRSPVVDPATERQERLVEDLQEIRLAI